jgi:hypothetical protein
MEAEAFSPTESADAPSVLLWRKFFPVGKDLLPVYIYNEDFPSRLRRGEGEIPVKVVRGEKLFCGGALRGKSPKRSIEDPKRIA